MKSWTTPEFWTALLRFPRKFRLPRGRRIDSGNKIRDMGRFGLNARVDIGPHGYDRAIARWLFRFRSDIYGSGLVLTMNTRGSFDREALLLLRGYVSFGCCLFGRI